MVRKLNELYKASVVSCQGLSLRLQRFFLDKQRLLDRIQSVTAEKLIFSHAVQTVGRVGQATAAWGRGWGMSRCWAGALRVRSGAGSPPGVWPQCRGSTAQGTSLATPLCESDSVSPTAKPEAWFSSFLVGECSPGEAAAGSRGSLGLLCFCGFGVFLPPKNGLRGGGGSCENACV